MNLHELKASQIRVNGGYWAKYEQLLKDVMFPQQWDFLEKVNGVSAFEAAAGLRMPVAGEDVGVVYGTLDAGKLMEGIGYYLLHHDEPEWRAKVERLIDAMEKAQLADGYLLPIKQMQGLNARFTNLLTEHEVYRMGNLIEGLLSYYDVSGSEKALTIAKKMGDCMCLHFGNEPGKIHGYDGHPSVEIALIKLYRATHDERYLKIQEYFVTARGTSPNFFEMEFEQNRAKHLEWGWGSDTKYWENFGYFLADRPLKEMENPQGHAVRACYFYAGAADLAYETGDAELVAVLKKIWDNMESNNVYITGGVGQHAHVEAFGKPYDLPPDDAYNETCASVALIFWAQRMFKLNPDVKYADMIERALYNGVMCGLQLDGTAYFYVNPLEVWPKNNYRKDKEHVKSRRQNWFSCACCPPSLARIIPQVATYFYMVGDDRVYVNQYGESTANLILAGQNITLEQRTQYPFEGKVSVKIGGAGNFALYLRKPYWCEEFNATVNGQAVEVSVQDGYLLLSRNWEDGDTIVLNMPMKARRVYANPLARHMDGCVALTYGPLVYCLEEADNFGNLRSVVLPDDAPLTVRFKEELLEGTIVIDAPGLVDDAPFNSLYAYDAPGLKPVQLRFIPYYKWANRDEGEMLVWIRHR